MHIEDLSGQIDVLNERDLLDRLRSGRRGSYGAFVLSHEDGGPFFHIHINGELAYLHYLPDYSGASAGFQASGMSPPDCPTDVHFLQIDGSEADSITMPAGTLVGVEKAYQAAKEFLQRPQLPSSITWLEL